LPYKATRVFPNIQLDLPTDVSWVASANKWVATQRRGKLVTFDNDPENAKTEPFLDLSEALGAPVSNAFRVLFHPDLQNQPWCFVTFMSKPKDENGVQLGRLRVTDPKGPTVDPTSLQVLASWSSKGHLGGTMQFGPDGMLYFGVGDGQRPYPPDANHTGQDLSDLQASIMRIDVNVTDPKSEQLYRIPPDNPFVGQANVREEIWAFGLRNPWKIAFDPVSGDLLAADVGWEMREMIHRVEKGRNHGWSIMEGSQSVKPEQKPTIPITPPLFEHTHLDSRSISGGHYWQSDRNADLKGAYIYGDWMTGKVWALKHDGDKVQWQKELVDTPLQIIGFMAGPEGDVKILGYDGSIWRLDPNTQLDTQNEFPNRLSKTGIFNDVVNEVPAAGVVQYQISANHWADGTHSRQWIAVPEQEQLDLFKKDNWQTGDTGGRFQFPENTVLAKTVSYFTDVDDPQSERRIETQLLHRYLDDWRAYNYIWNEQQTDAILQDDVATETKLVIKDPTAQGGMRSQTWRHTSRSECLLCHTWGMGSVHAFWPEQLSIQVAGESQMERLARLGLFAEPIPSKTPPPSPHDHGEDLESRARSYLGLNCATCHRNLGGGTANFNFDLTKTLEENNYIGEPPAQGSFGLESACVVAPRDPLRSVVIYRMLKSGRGHMPQFGANVIDLRGVRLLRDWIESMPMQSGSLSKGSQSVRNKLAVLLDAKSESEQKHTIESLLTSTSGAIALSLACSEESIDPGLKNLITDLGNAQQQPEIRDLFEHYLPEEQRVKRLGPTIDANALLAMKGSIKRGKLLFEQAKDINCRACHRIAAVGQNVGPDLSSIGVKQKPKAILDSILNPSAKIDEKFRARKILTIDGKAIVGMVINEDEEKLSIVDTTGKAQSLLVDDIELMQPATKSAMPEQLLSGMTAQQAADLLAFLSAQTRVDPSERTTQSN
jgi:putative heme-binding domain-containing protein